MRTSGYLRHTNGRAEDSCAASLFLLYLAVDMVPAYAFPPVPRFSRPEIALNPNLSTDSVAKFGKARLAPPASK